MHPRKIQEFLAHTSCYQCGKDLKTATLNTLVETSLAHIVHISCARCQAEIVATVTISGTGAMKVITDLQPQELGRFMKQAPVSSDEVLDIHELLAKETLWNLLGKNAPLLTAKPKKSAKQAASQQ